MKYFFFLTFCILHFAFCIVASGQTRSNRIYRPCPGTTTKAQVAIDTVGNIAITPCPGKTVTIDGSAPPTILRSYLASTVTYNNTATLTNTPLSVSVVAGGVYQVSLVVHETNVARTLNLDFAGTATVLNFIGQWDSRGTVSCCFTANLRVSSAGTDYTNGAVGGSGENAFYTFNGSVEFSSAGTFTLRAAQDAADVSNTAILRGSSLILTRLN